MCRQRRMIVLEDRVVMPPSSAVPSRRGSGMVSPRLHERILNLLIRLTSALTASSLRTEGTTAMKFEMGFQRIPSEDLPEMARQAVKMKDRYGRPLVFWAQLGLESEEAKKILDEGKIPYVMNRCMRVEHGRM